MGKVVASDIFQRKLDSIYIGLSGVTGIADDMVVYGRSEQEHDNNLIQFLETTRKNGLRLNKEKLQFKQTEVSFFGHLWSTKGISPDPKKIKSILEMNFPEDKETMHSFLGLVNFLNRYSPQLAELSSPLRDLIQKDAHYRITDIHKQAFASIKSEFSAKITLPYFSKDKETLLQTDASKKGFGAVLIQDNKPVYFASRTLTPSEKNYQNLERKCMAAVWGMEKFHYYLYGGHFTLQTDQKPLVAIFKKHLCDVSPRIQRIAIRSWQYDFNTVWIKGKLNVIADALSRVSPQDVEPNIEQESPIFAVNTLTNFQEGEEKMALMEETAKDPEFSALHKLISEGWPPKRSNVPDNLKDYWNYRDELTVENGILLKSHKFIVPKNLQSVYINKIHAGHLGINKSLQKAREYLFWKGYTKDISEAIDKCTLCQENAPSNPQCFQYISEVPPHPWHTLGTDLFYHRKQDYLVLVDYFSKFLIVRKIPNSTTGAIVKDLSITFSEYGIPFIIRSDNGPCYSSQEFKTFLQDLQVTHHTSSPHYPQSNGMAESMIKVSKNLIEKAIQSDQPWHSFIQEYRITPLSSTIPSPAEILFGRQFRSNLSILPSQLTNSRTAYIREEIAKKENKLHEKPTPVADLVPGQPIWHQDPLTKKWLPGAVQEKLQEPHSYSITSQDTTGETEII